MAPSKRKKPYILKKFKRGLIYTLMNNRYIFEKYDGKWFFRDTLSEIPNDSHDKLHRLKERILKQHLTNEQEKRNKKRRKKGILTFAEKITMHRKGAKNASEIFDRRCGQEDSERGERKDDAIRSGENQTQLDEENSSSENAQVRTGTKRGKHRKYGSHCADGVEEHRIRKKPWIIKRDETEGEDEDPRTTDRLGKTEEEAETVSIRCVGRRGISKKK